MMQGPVSIIREDTEPLLHHSSGNHSVDKITVMMEGPVSIIREDTEPRLHHSLGNHAPRR